MGRLAGSPNITVCEFYVICTRNLPTGELYPKPVAGDIYVDIASVFIPSKKEKQWQLDAGRVPEVPEVHRHDPG